MKIIFLGTSHGFCEDGMYCSSTAVTVKGRTYLVDAGAPVTGLLQKHGISPGSVRAIFLTHNHGDHNFGLPEFVIQMNGGYFKKQYPNAHVEIYVPDLWLYEQTLQGDVHTPVTDLKIYEEGLIYQDDLIRVSAFRTEHDRFTYGFLLEAENKRVVFSGDMKGRFPDYPAVLTQTDVDVAIVESAHARYTKPEVLERLKQTRTRFFLVNHYYPAQNPPEVLEEFAEQTKDRFETILARDGDTFLL